MFFVSELFGQCFVQAHAVEVLGRAAGAPAAGTGTGARTGAAAGAGAVAAAAEAASAKAAATASAAEAAATFDIKIYTIFVGGDGRIPMARLDDNNRIVRDRRGNPIYAGDASSAGDDGTLKKIAEITGGKFYRVRPFGSSLPHRQ